MTDVVDDIIEPILSTDIDPFDVFAQWMHEASEREINDPNAMTVASVDADGLPNARVVLLNGVDPAGVADRGFVFYTNLESQKGRELLGSGKAALLFHWKSMRRQIRIRGPIAQIANEEADRYFATRARDSRIGAWASQQSRPLKSRADLQAEIARLETTYPDDNVPRPPHWSGLRVVPSEIEFWQERTYRLHDRVVLRRDSGAEAWVRTRLNP
ncbi:MAG: pyridoxamine 5'-phosphate oxidase [Pseudomonadota bacterium]